MKYPPSIESAQCTTSLGCFWNLPRKFPICCFYGSTTCGAIDGQLAGAFYGVNAIPERWRFKFARLDVLESLAARLHDRADV